MKNLFRIFLYSILTVVGVCIIGTRLNPHGSPGGRAAAFVGFGRAYWFALGAALVAYTIHALTLRQLRRFSTRSARWIGIALFLGLPIFATALMMVLGLERKGLEEALEMLLAFLISSFLFFLVFPGFIIFSMPSSLPATLPLLAHYLFLTTFFAFLGRGSLSSTGFFSFPPPVLFYSIYLTLAGYLFPAHRRLREFWHPSRLPRHMMERKGFTLIELLIVVAIMAIMSLGISNMSSNTHRLVERQANWRAATALAEEQFDLLRAQGVLPALGRHPIDPEIAGHFPLAKQAELEVKPGPGERFREVWVHVRMRGDANDKAVSLAAILPAAPAKEVK